MRSDTEDLDLDFDSDFGDDFDDLSLEVAAPEKDRNPVAASAEVAVDTVITKVTDKDQMLDAVKAAMPHSYRTTAEFGEKQLTAMRNAKQAALEPIRKELPMFKRNLNRLTPVVEQYLGKSAADRFSLITDARKDRPDVDQNALEIKSGLEQAFGNWQENQAKLQARQMTQDMLAEQTEESRYNAQYELLASMDLTNRKQLAFNESVFANVLRQNLELDYKRNHLLSGILRVNTESFGLAITELRNITKNTGLPDLVKQRNNETFKQLFLEEWQGRTAKSAVDFGRNYFTQWGENIVTRAREIGTDIADTMAQVGDAAGMYADIQQDQQELMGDAPRTSLRDEAGNLVGGIGGKLAAEKAVGFAQNKLGEFLKENEQARRLGQELSLFNATRVESVRRFIDDQIEKGGALSGPLQFLQDLAPTLGQDRENVRNNLIDRITDKAEWDNLQRETLVTIIPGWFAKIHQAIKELNWGEGNVAQERYDLYTQRFVTDKEATESMLRNLVTNDERDDLNEKVDGLIETLFEDAGDDQPMLSEAAKEAFKDALVEQSRNNPDIDIDALLRDGTYQSGDSEVIRELTDALNKMLNDGKEETLGVRDVSDEGLSNRVRLARGFKTVGSSGAVEELQTRLNAIDRGGNLDLLRNAGLLDADGKIIHTELNKLLYQYRDVSAGTGGNTPKPPTGRTPPTNVNSTNNTMDNRVYTDNDTNVDIRNNESISGRDKHTSVSSVTNESDSKVMVRENNVVRFSDFAKDRVATSLKDRHTVLGEPRLTPMGPPNVRNQVTSNSDNVYADNNVSSVNIVSENSPTVNNTTSQKLYTTELDGDAQYTYSTSSPNSEQNVNNLFSDEFVNAVSRSVQNIQPSYLDKSTNSSSVYNAAKNTNASLNPTTSYQFSDSTVDNRRAQTSDVRMSDITGDTLRYTSFVPDYSQTQTYGDVSTNWTTNSNINPQLWVNGDRYRTNGNNYTFNASHNADEDNYTSNGDRYHTEGNTTNQRVQNALRQIKTSNTQNLQYHNPTLQTEMASYRTNHYGGDNIDNLTTYSVYQDGTPDYSDNSTINHLLTKDYELNVNGVKVNLADKICTLVDNLEQRYVENNESNEYYHDDSSTVTNQTSAKPSGSPMLDKMDAVLEELTTLTAAMESSSDGIGNNTELLEEIRGLVAAVASGNVVDSAWAFDSIKSKAKSLFSKPIQLLRGGRKRVSRMISKGKSMISGIRRGAQDRVQSAFRFANRKLSDYTRGQTDIYVEGDVSPSLLGRDINRGIYYNYVNGEVVGKAIANIDDINGPVYNTETDQVVISQEDYGKGLYTRKQGVFKKAKELSGELFRAPLTITRKLKQFGGDTISTAGDFITDMYQSIKESVNKVTDVYTKDGRLAMTAKDIKEGRYYYLKDGKQVQIRSFKDLLSVEGSIYETADGQPKVVISPDDIKEGLRNVSGDKLRMKGLGSLAGRGVAAAGGLASKLFKLPMTVVGQGSKLLKGLMDGAVAKATFLRLPDDTIFQTQNVYVYSTNDPVFNDKETSVQKRTKSQHAQDINISNRKYTNAETEVDVNREESKHQSSSEVETNSTKTSTISKDELSETVSSMVKRIFNRVEGQDKLDEGGPKTTKKVWDNIVSRIEDAKLFNRKDATSSISEYVDEKRTSLNERAKQFYEEHISDRTRAKVDKAKESIRNKMSSVFSRKDTDSSSSDTKKSEISKLSETIKTFIKNRENKTKELLSSTTDSLTTWFEEQEKKKAKKTVKGDVDGDGFRDGGWRDSLKRLAEKRKALREDKEEKPTKTEKSESNQHLGKIVSILGGIAGGLSKFLGMGVDSLMGGVKLAQSLSAGSAASNLLKGGLAGGSATAGTAAASKAGMRETAKRGFKTFASKAGKFGAKKLALAGVGVMAGIAAAPWVALGVTIAATAWSIWEVGSSIYGWFDRRRDTDPFEFARFLQYGYYTGNDGDYERNKVNLRYFEKEMLSRVETTKSGKGDILMSPSQIWEKYAGDLGGDTENKGEEKQFGIWYRARFKPVLFRWVSAVSVYRTEGGDPLTFSSIADSIADDDRQSFVDTVMNYKALSWDPLMMREGASNEMPVAAMRPDIEAYMDKYILKLSDVEMAAKKEKRRNKPKNLDDKVVFRKPVNKNYPDKKELLVAKTLSEEAVVAKPPTSKSNNANIVPAATPDEGRLRLIKDKLSVQPTTDRGRLISTETQVGDKVYVDSTTVRLINTLNRTDHQESTHDARQSESSREEIINRLSRQDTTTSEVETIDRSKMATTSSAMDSISSSTSQQHYNAVVNSKLAIYEDYISEASKLHNVDERVIRAIIKETSGGNRNYEDDSGRVGLMPVSANVAQSFGVGDRQDPRSSILGGTLYFKHLLELFGGNTRQALVAYIQGSDKLAEVYHKNKLRKDTNIKETVYVNDGSEARTEQFVHSVERHYTDSSDRTREVLTNDKETVTGRDRFIESQFDSQRELERVADQRIVSDQKTFRERELLVNHKELRVEMYQQAMVDTAIEQLEIMGDQLKELRSISKTVSGFKVKVMEAAKEGHHATMDYDEKQAKPATEAKPASARVGRRDQVVDAEHPVDLNRSY